ncbi:MAG: Ig-like domain-containing protein [Cryomorphaceae bacterium]|nr:Ig-like domain-containing protein [Cryomorphaceae bacterium]
MRRIFTLSVVAALIVGLSSCRQDDRDYEVSILVTVHDTVPVRNATVELFAPVEGSIVNTQRTTNANGIATFSFSNKAFLEVHAVKGSWKKCDAIELEKGMKEFTINMYPFGDPRRTCLGE